MKYGKKSTTKFYVMGATLVVLAISLLAYARTSAAPTTLSPNDVVIVTANSDTSYLANACLNSPNSNRVDLLLRRSIGSGTVIKVTDNPWNGSAFANNSEGTITYTAPTDLPAGTVIPYTDCIEQTAGSDWVRDGSFDAATANGDTLLVYQGSAATPSFLYGFSFRSANWITTGTITSANSRIPAALTSASPLAYSSGTTARNYQYTTAGNYGIYSATFLNNLRTIGNWATTGTAASAGTQFGQTTVPFDATRPTFNDAVRYSPASELTNASSVKFRITTSEAVQALAANAFTVTTTGTLTHGAVTTIAINSSTYEITVTGITGDGTIALDQFVAASLLDARGNPATDVTFTSESYTIDTTPLTGTVQRRAGQPLYTQTNSAWFTLTLSEDIADSSLAVADIQVGTTTGTVAALNKISETVYEFQVTGMTSGDVITASIPAGMVSDLAGNVNAAQFTGPDNRVFYDTTAPHIFAVHLDVESPGYSLDHPQVTWGATDGQSGMSHYTISVDGGAFVPATSPYDATLVPAASHTIVVRAYDRAGNVRESTVVYPPIENISAPTTLSNAPITDTTIEIIGPTGMVVTNVAITGAGSSGFTCTPTPGPGAVLPMTCSGGQITSTGTLTVAATTDSGVTTQNTQAYVIDTVPPTVTVNRAASQSHPTSTDSATFTVTFSEAMNAASFTAGDIALSGTTGTATGFVQIDSRTWEVTVTGMSPGDTVTATLPAHSATDVAGNGNIASTGTQNTVTYDGTPPVITVNHVNSNNTSLQLSGTIDDPTATIQITILGVSYAVINNGDGTWSLPIGTIVQHLQMARMMLV